MGHNNRDTENDQNTDYDNRSIDEGRENRDKSDKDLLDGGDGEE